MELLNKGRELLKRITWQAWTVIGIIIVLLLIIPPVLGRFKEEAAQEKVKPVKVLVATVQAEPLSLEYLGTVNAVEVTKYSFKSPGRLDRVLVSQGQAVAQGQKLAELDKEELTLALQAALNTREQAKSAYQFALDSYEKVLKLWEAGAVSRQEVDRAKTELDNLQAVYNNAQIDCQFKEKSLQDSTLTANQAGYVAEIFYEEGEMVPAGYPVLVLRGEELEITVGVTQDDWSKIKVGMAARAVVQGREINGQVSSVGQLPDEYTLTFPVTVRIDDNSLPIGASARVYLDVGEEKGIFVPITAVGNDGSDFVYVLDDDLVAHKRVVSLGRIKGTDVLVEGLAEGELVVKEGLRRLKDGDRVRIQE